MMAEDRMSRIAEKYGSRTGAAPSPKKVELRAGGGGNEAREKAMSGGKPKNTGKTIKRLFFYLSREKARLIAGIGFALVHEIAMLTGTYSLRRIMNSYVATGDIANLAKALMILAAVYIISVSTQIFSQYLMLGLSQSTLKHMRKELFDKLQSLPIKYYDTHSTGDIMSRFTNDIDTIGDLLNTTLIQTIEGVITLTGICVLMVYTDWLLASITLVIAPVMILATNLLIKYGRAPYRAQQRQLGILNGYAEEMINGQRVIKVFNHEDAVLDEFGYINDSLAASSIKAQFFSSMMNPVTHNLCNLNYALTASLGGIFVITRGLDIGALTVFVNYTRQFQRPINDVTTQSNTIFSALAGAERVFEVMDETEETEDSDEISLEKIVGRVELKNVGFGYTEDSPVLHDITLTAEKGQKIAFVGSTGAGKTTITNLLNRFYDIDKGQITIDGIPINRINRRFLRQNVAMVLQDTHLFTGTVMENIRYGRLDATDEDVIRAAKAARAHSFIVNLENGYDTVIENDGAGLSQGQRQLINIARALISESPILVLDEATSSVDTRTERQIESGMDELMKNRTTFVIAHRLSTVRQADAIMVMEHGSIIERGIHDELLEQKGVYYELYNELAQLT
ncbi:MAG: ABC transporter ATP-binding protein/permease [Eubacteriales bacterium]|nr:ABC transporter ATP-binding protein/permease [Eubacteriales bacterium]